MFISSSSNFSHKAEVKMSMPHVPSALFVFSTPLTFSVDLPPYLAFASNGVLNSISTLASEIFD